MVTVTHHGARSVRAVIQFLRSILKLRTRCAKIKKAARIRCRRRFLGFRIRNL